MSTCGPDEILLQCFPIKPNNFAEIKLEIVCPMQLDTTDDRGLGATNDSRKNFLQEQPVKVEVTSKHPARVSGIVDAGSKSEVIGQNEVVHQEKERSSQLVSLSSLNGRNAVIHARRDHSIHAAYCHDTFAYPACTVAQNIEHVQRQEPLGLTVIVDASAVMQPYIDEIVEGLKSIRANVPVQLNVVGDSTKSLLLQPTYSTDPSFNCRA